MKIFRFIGFYGINSCVKTTQLDAILEKTQSRMRNQFGKWFYSAVGSNTISDQLSYLINYRLKPNECFLCSCILQTILNSCKQKQKRNEIKINILWHY